MLATLPYRPTPQDAHWLQRALDQADLALPHCAPNPAVGCVLVAADGQAHALGHTQAVGQAHAEIMALRAAQQQGMRVPGSTVYVTLEPCAHTGRTGPCVQALLQAQVARVVIALIDPNPLVAGKSLALLRAAGVAVDVLAVNDALALAARDQMAGFFSRMERGRPWVRLKLASSVDGQMALANGQSQWITGAAARADGQVWRARASVVLTGVGTVLADDPRLTVRDVPFTVTRQPELCICDTQLRTPLNAQLWQAQDRQVLLYGGMQADLGKRLVLQDKGAHVLQGGDWPTLWQALHARQCNEVHVECGPTLAGALLQQGQVDELLHYIGPCLLGPGRGFADLPQLHDLSHALRLHALQCAPVGDSLRLRAWMQPRVT